MSEDEIIYASGWADPQDFLNRHLSGKIKQETNMPSIGEQDTRLECLKLAVETRHGDVIRLAGDFYNFVIAKDARNVRETVLDALNEAGVD